MSQLSADFNLFYFTININWKFLTTHYNIDFAKTAVDKSHCSIYYRQNNRYCWQTISAQTNLNGQFRHDTGSSLTPLLLRVIRRRQPTLENWSGTETEKNSKFLSKRRSLGHTGPPPPGISAGGHVNVMPKITPGTHSFIK